MKKNKKLLRYVLCLFISLLFTPITYSFLETIKEYPVTSLGVAALAGVLSDEAAQALKDLRAFQLKSIRAERRVGLYSLQIQKGIDEIKLKQDVPTKDLMEQLVNREIVFGKYPVKLFPTIESKVFVLDNISDFFNFDKDKDQTIKDIANEYKNQINQSELKALEEKKALYNWINKELRYFKSMYNISAENLKIMTQEEVKNKIELIQQNLQNLIAKNNIKNPEVPFLDISENGGCRVLLALLAHFIYKQENKKIAQQSEVVSQDSPKTTQQSLFAQFLAWLRRFSAGILILL